MTTAAEPVPAGVGVPLTVIAGQWGRIGCIGFGGPPAHISLLRRLCVKERGWLSDDEFEQGIAATNLLPGPASTQLAIFCAWRLRGTRGAVVGGLCFIVPGLVLILALAAMFLGSPPLWVRGCAAGAGAAVPAVALSAAASLLGPSRRNAEAVGRWACYCVAGAVAGALAGPYLVLVLLACGLLEVAAGRMAAVTLPLAMGLPVSGGLGAVAWVALKVGLLSYGGGFVIIPLMRSDAVDHYHWMTGGAFLNAVALGQVTPGPVVQTVAVVGYAAAGLGGGLLAAGIAFAPSFAMVLLGARHFEQLRTNTGVQAFLRGAGPAVIGAIAGSAVPLAGSLHEAWQYGILAMAAAWLLLRRGHVVPALLVAAALGVTAALAGALVPG